MNPDDELMGSVDRESPTWAAVLKWAERCREESGRALFVRSNTRDDDVYHRGRASAFHMLLRVGEKLKSPKEDQS